MGSCQHAAIIAGLLQFQHLVFFLIPREQSFTASGVVSGKLSSRISPIPAPYL